MAKDMDISGVTLESAGKTIYTAPKGTVVKQKGHLLLEGLSGVDAASAIDLKLMSGTEQIARFSRNIELGTTATIPVGGSYTRMPDITGKKWYAARSATPGEENFAITNHVGLWMWSSSLGSANWADLASKGIGHVLLNEAYFTSHSDGEIRTLVEQAAAAGVIIHVWQQCFYSNGEWISPVDDSVPRYKQEVYDEIIRRALHYIDLGIKGIHFDYIRFGGTGMKHDFPEKGITAVGAITEFCRQVSEAVDKVNKHVILSAALMAEGASGIPYYGQDPAQMGKYIDILMPMIYRYSANGGNRGANWAINMANYYADNSSGAEVWPGTTTYDIPGATENTLTGLSAERILEDCQDFMKSRATGVVLFRFTIGNIGNMTGQLWDK
jgi:hypothetical protein